MSLTWDELATMYDKYNSGRKARTLPMQTVADWAMKRTDLFYVDSKDEFNMVEPGINYPKRTPSPCQEVMKHTIDKKDFMEELLKKFLNKETLSFDETMKVNIWFDETPHEEVVKTVQRLLLKKIESLPPVCDPLKQYVITIDKEGKLLIAWEIDGITSRRLYQFVDKYEQLKLIAKEVSQTYKCKVIDRHLAMKQLNFGYN